MLASVAAVAWVALPRSCIPPPVGLGVAGPRFEDEQPGAAAAVEAFLRLGGRHIDTATMYRNHRAVGSGIRGAVAAGVPRESVFLTTKVAAGTPPRLCFSHPFFSVSLSLSFLCSGSGPLS